MRGHEHDHTAQAGPGYPSPEVARQAEPERFIYVPALYEGTGIDRPDLITVVDVDPQSSSYGRVVGRTEMPNVGDELHHFGWNACSSACHSQLSRDTLVVPRFRSRELAARPRARCPGSGRTPLGARSPPRPGGRRPAGGRPRWPPAFGATA